MGPIPSNVLRARERSNDKYGMRKVSASEFLERARVIQKDNYDYSRVVFTNMNTKVEIVCDRHGSFLQTPKKHVIGQGCPRCKALTLKKKNAFSFDVFLTKCKRKHRDAYRYPNPDEYENNTSKITIECLVHGTFQQTAASHMNGRGCQKCFDERRGTAIKERSATAFIEKAKLQHGDLYDYSESVYVKSHDPITIICRRHGPWVTRPSLHLSGHGCPRCVHRISKPEQQWLDSMGVPLRQHTLPEYGWSVDGFDPATNTVYEFHGDFWHGNPNRFDPEDVNPVCKTKFGDLYASTKAKEQSILAAGYNLIVKWETSDQQFERPEVFANPFL
jgi:hypothetical protein